ncbi:MAG TPA: NIPSNAP family protein [Flavobacterium sp.]|nr:NIPSNAP family protein [Flavobacterium sp.]
MIIVQETFICKPGNASKLAKLFKEIMTDNRTELIHILTDMTGEFNKVIMLSQYDSLSAYEQSFEKYMQDNDEIKKMKEKMKGYHDMYFTGSREIYQVW